jgi:hypothetical protein
MSDARYLASGEIWLATTAFIVPFS